LRDTRSVPGSAIAFISVANPIAKSTRSGAAFSTVQRSFAPVNHAIAELEGGQAAADGGSPPSPLGGAGSVV
jgi:hypothetical protein